MRENIENGYEDVIKNVDSVIRIKDEQEVKKIDEEYYNNFKTRLEGYYPKLLNLIAQIEKEMI